MRAPGFAKHPNHTVVINPTDTEVTVHASGEEIATTNEALILLEDRYDPVYYLPLTDIKSDVLRLSETETYCPFKGTASYWHVAINNRIIEDALWGYKDPYEECMALKDYVAFYTTKVTLTAKDK